MTFAQPHLLITHSGVLPGGETWSCGIRTDTVVTYSQAAMDTLGAAAVSAYGAFHNILANGIGAGATFELIRFRFVDTSGVTLDLNEYSPVAPVTGGGTTSKPNQCAIVITLTTATPSRRGRGRVYIPSVGPSAMTSGKMAATQRDSLATSGKTWLDALNTALDTFQGGVELAVQSNVGAGASNVITGLRVGDVIDTQRRRRDNLIESYTARTLA